MSPVFWRKTRSVLIPIVTVCVILGTSAAVIAYGRGYRLDFRKTSVKPTGLVSVTSDPIAAQVFIDGKLKTATNNSFNIDPGWYTVKIAKEGYQPWEKKLRVQGEVVTRADAFLFPTNPSLSPLTSLGLDNPILSPDGTKIVFTIAKSLDGSKKSGLWVYQLSEGPLGRNRDAQQIGPYDGTFDFDGATITWSPDSNELLVQSKSNIARLYQTTRASFQDATIRYQELIRDWEDERQTKERQKLAAFKQPIIDMASSSAKIISFSPDETKILYEATASATIPNVIEPPLIGTNPTQEQRKIEPGKLYVYDSKEDKNYFVLDKKELPTPKATPTSKVTKPVKKDQKPPLVSQNGIPLHWFPTSRHLVLTLEGKIDIMEFDRTNWITVYSGPFVDGFIAPWPTGSRIVIMTNLNPNVVNLPNLYTVNLR